MAARKPPRSPKHAATWIRLKQLMKAAFVSIAVSESAKQSTTSGAQDAAAETPFLILARDAAGGDVDHAVEQFRFKYEIEYEYDFCIFPAS